MVLDFVSEFIDESLTGSIVKRAKDVAEAMQLVEAHSFSLIISDYEMPGAHGGNFLEFLRDINYQTQLIFFTGRLDLNCALDYPLVKIFNDKNYEKMFNYLENDWNEKVF